MKFSVLVFSALSLLGVLHAGQWGAPLHVGYGTEVQVALDEKGNGVSVWTTGPGHKSFIQAGVLALGTSEWKLLHLIPPLDSDICYCNPAVVLNRKGDALISWRAKKADAVAVMGAILPFGCESLEEPFFFSYPLQELVSFKTALGDQGNVLAVWEEALSSGTHKVGAAFVPAGSDVMQVDLGVGSLPCLSMNEQGEALALWAGHVKMWAARFPELKKEEVVRFRGVAPQLLLDNQGNALAFWKRDRGPNCQIEGAVRLSHGKRWHQVLGLPRADLKTLEDPIQFVYESGVITALWTDVEAGETVLRGTTLKSGSRETSKHFVKRPDPISLEKVAVNAAGQKIAIREENEQLISAFYAPFVPPGSPAFARGKQVTEEFFAETDVVNRLVWAAPSAGDPVVAYKIYRDSQLKELVATIEKDKPLIFEEHNIKRGVRYTYFIVAISAEGLVSSPAYVSL